MTASDSSSERRAGRISDARGRRVKQLDPVALHLLRQYDVVDADSLRLIVNEVGVKVAVTERIALIAGAACALTVIGLFTYAVATGDVRNARYAKLASMVYICILPWIIWFGVKRKRFGTIAAAMLKHKRCPHCGYDLRGLLSAKDDDATVCPECGCAWNLARAARCS